MHSLPWLSGLIAALATRMDSIEVSDIQKRGTAQSSPFSPDITSNAAQQLNQPNPAFINHFSDIWIKTPRIPNTFRKIPDIRQPEIGFEFKIDSKGVNPDFSRLAQYS